MTLDLPGLEQALALIASATLKRLRRARGFASPSHYPLFPRGLVLQAFVDLVPRFIAERTRDRQGRALAERPRGL